MKLKSIKSGYIDAVKNWNKVHRIVGDPDSLENLIAQSEGALLELINRGFVGRAWVDVGCGSGLLGVPLLYLDIGAKVLFVDTNPKKTAFLHYYLSKVWEFRGRYFVYTGGIDVVSRETVKNFLDPDECILVSRAFSGSSDLEGLIFRSIFKKNKKIFVYSNNGGVPHFENSVK